MISAYPPPQQKTKWTDIVSVASSIAAFITTILIFLQKELSISYWILLIPLLLIATTLLILSGKSLIRIFSFPFRNLKAMRKKADLMYLAERLRVLLSGNSSEGIRSAFGHLCQTGNWRSLDILTDDTAEVYELWLGYLIERLNKTRLTYKSFGIFKRELWNIAIIFSRKHFGATFEKIRRQGIQNVDAQMKGEIDLAYGHYVAFLRNLQEFLDKSSAEFSCSKNETFIDFPKPL